MGTISGTGREHAGCANGMAHDLGYYEEKLGEEAFIKKTGSRFDLVMITEMLDESLVLLKRMLGVPIGEVYAGWFKENTGKRTKPTERQEKMIEEVTQLDHKLYSHFRSRLEGEWRSAKHSGGESQLQALKKQAREVDPACRKKNNKVCPVALRTDVDPD